MAEVAELTAAQRDAVFAFGEACALMFAALNTLELAEVPIVDALRHLPGSEEGRSMYDELPAGLRMMIA